MNEKPEVRMVTLPPIRVACVNGYGESPESLAFDKMLAWAKGRDLLQSHYRLFGYNNPDPSPGSPKYGYDVWMSVDASVQSGEGARIIEFPGGFYAVTRCEVVSPGEDIPATWQRLVRWREGSRYHHGTHQWLEEHIGKLEDMGGRFPFALDLYLPIRE